MPEESKKLVKYDIDGYEELTKAIGDLLNQYPALPGNLSIDFSTLSDNGGIAWYPVTGAVIADERRSVTGKVRQVCNYPFYIVYRAGGPSAQRKAAIKEWLDGLGKWLEKQPINVNGGLERLEDYPTLTSGRIITEIARQTPAYLDSISESKVEDWAMHIVLKYKNEFKRASA